MQNLEESRIDDEDSRIKLRKLFEESRFARYENLFQKNFFSHWFIDLKDENSILSDEEILSEEDWVMKKYPGHG